MSVAMLSTPVLLVAATLLPGGEYVHRSEGLVCSLAVAAEGRFLLRCGDEPPVEGTVEAMGEVLYLSRPTGLITPEDWQRWRETSERWNREVAAAAEAHMSKEEATHGYVPSIRTLGGPEPPRAIAEALRQDDRKDLNCVFFLVKRGATTFLVDGFLRESFCRVPIPRHAVPPGRHYVFQSTGSSEGVGLDEATFCADTWKPKWR